MEYWDLCDRDRNPLGVIHPRGLNHPLPPGAYHVAVTVFTVSADGYLLLSRRAPGKRMYPGYREVTAGSAVAGENSSAAALRELFEETGVDGTRSGGGAGLTFLTTVREPTAFMDCYLAHLCEPADAVSLTPQAGETTDFCWVRLRVFETLIHEGQIPPPVAMRYGAALDRLRARLGDDLWLMPTKEEEHG